MILRNFGLALLLIPAAMPSTHPPIPVEEAVDQGPFSFAERLMRLCYFRLAVSEEDYLENLIDVFCETLNIASWQTQAFIPAVAEKTLDAFRQMGASEHYVSTLDGKGTIHTLIFESKKLEEKIDSYGALWQRIKSGNKTLFAILPPKSESAEWEKFEKKCLATLGWKKRTILLEAGEQTQAWVTCEDADLIADEQVHQFCFIHCHSNSHSFVREQKRAGYYLGMKQDLCFFDHRGVGYSRGAPSEVAFYLDVEAVYDLLQKQAAHPVQNVWVGGFCAGAPVAAFLKSRLHELGINYYSEQSFPDLKRDFIGNQNIVIRWLGKRGISGLRSRDIPRTFPGRPCEYQFSIEKMWGHLPYQRQGKVIILHTLNDQFLPAKVRLRFIEIAQAVNRNVIPIFYFSTNLRDVHSDDFYLYPDIQRSFTQAVFK